MLGLQTHHPMGQCLLGELSNSWNTLQAEAIPINLAKQFKFKTGVTTDVRPGTSLAVSPGDQCHMHGTVYRAAPQERMILPRMSTAPRLKSCHLTGATKVFKPQLASVLGLQAGPPCTTLSSPVTRTPMRLSNDTHTLMKRTFALNQATPKSESDNRKSIVQYLRALNT